MTGLEAGVVIVGPRALAADRVRLAEIEIPTFDLDAPRIDTMRLLDEDQRARAPEEERIRLVPVGRPFEFLLEAEREVLVLLVPVKVAVHVADTADLPGLDANDVAGIRLAAALGL